jgi:hypothetical protein
MTKKKMHGFENFLDAKNLTFRQVDTDILVIFSCMFFVRFFTIIYWKKNFLVMVVSLKFFSH